MLFSKGGLSQKGRSYTNKQHGGFITSCLTLWEKNRNAQYRTSHFLRRLPRTVLLQKGLFHPNYQLSHTVQLLPLVEWQLPLLHQKLLARNGFQNQRNSEVPNPFSKSARTVWYCGVNLETADHDGFCSFKVVDVFFVYQVACICCPGWFQLLSGSSQSGASAAKSSRPHIVALGRWNLLCLLYVDMMTTP